MDENETKSKDGQPTAEPQIAYTKPVVTKVDVYETGALGGSCAGGTLADVESCEFTS